MTAADIRPLLSVADVAIVVGMSEHTIRQAIRDGDLVASKLRGRIRIDPRDVLRWINDSTITPNGPTVLPAPTRLVPPPVRPLVATPDNVDALLAAARRKAA